MGRVSFKANFSCLKQNCSERALVVLRQKFNTNSSCCNNNSSEEEVKSPEPFSANHEGNSKQWNKFPENRKNVNFFFPKF